MNIAKKDLLIIKRSMEAYVKMLDALSCAGEEAAREKAAVTDLRDQLFSEGPATEAGVKTRCPLCEDLFDAECGTAIMSMPGRAACPICAELIVSVEGEKPVPAVGLDIDQDDLDAIMEMAVGETYVMVDKHSRAPHTRTRNVMRMNER